MTSVSVPVVDYSLQPHQGRRSRWAFWAVIAIVAIGLFFSILVPTMCRSSEVANRIKSSSNLRQLGLAMTMYANAHGQVMPANWTELALNTELSAGNFISPSSNDDWPRDQDPKRWAAGLDVAGSKSCSYRYAGDGLTAQQAGDPKTVLAFEPTDHNGGDGIHVLWGDGTVDWFAVAEDGETQRRYQQLLTDQINHVRPLRWVAG